MNSHETLYRHSIAEQINPTDFSFSATTKLMWFWGDYFMSLLDMMLKIQMN